MCHEISKLISSGFSVSCFAFSTAYKAPIQLRQKKKKYLHKQPQEMHKSKFQGNATPTYYKPLKLIIQNHNYYVIKYDLQVTENCKVTPYFVIHITLHQNG